MSTAGKITTKGVRKEAGLGGQPDDVKLVHIFINIIFACSILSIFYASLYAKTNLAEVASWRLQTKAGAQSNMGVGIKEAVMG